MSLNFKMPVNINIEFKLIFSFIFSLAAFGADSIDTIVLKKILTSKSQKVIVLDVRTPNEWSNTGIIKGALTINAYDPMIKHKLKQLDKNKKYYIYCHSGGRSSNITELMSSLGFKSINVKDGVVGWIKNKLPLVKYQK